MINITTPIDMSLTAMKEVSSWTDEELIQELRSEERLMTCGGGLESCYIPILIEAVSRILLRKPN